MTVKDRALTDKQLSSIIPVSEAMLRQARYRPNLKAPPHFREGRRVLYWHSEALAWAAAHGITPGPYFKKDTPKC